MVHATEVRPPKQESSIGQGVADSITALCGDMRFVYLHVALFAAWIGTRGFGSDHFPFNFLTMAVSLEAIFLSTFILISQNRQQAISETYNKTVQDALLTMLRDIIDDEKLDQKNEEMIQTLLNRIDVDHIQPIARQIASMNAGLGRVEESLASK